MPRPFRLRPKSWYQVARSGDLVPFSPFYGGMAAVAADGGKRRRFRTIIVRFRVSDERMATARALGFGKYRKGRDCSEHGPKCQPEKILLRDRRRERGAQRKQYKCKAHCHSAPARKPLFDPDVQGVLAMRLFVSHVAFLVAEGSGWFAMKASSAQEHTREVTRLPVE